MTTLFRTRKPDPTKVAAARKNGGERVVTDRGHYVSADAVGPAARIYGRDGVCREIIVSQRDASLGYDE